MTLNFKLSELAAITKGEILKGDENSVIQSVFLDSRNLSVSPNSVFIALQGLHHDGHDYIKELVKRGICHFIVSDTTNLPRGKYSVLVVKDGLQALQKIAIAHRNKFSIPVLGITGSNGKTMVKEWLCHLLGDSVVVTKSPKSYNSQVGVPLSVLGLTPDSQVGIFEAGISQPGEMSNLEQIIQPTMGLFTHFGDAHSENFKSNKGRLKEKFQLFKNCETIIFNDDQEKIYNAFKTYLGRHVDRFTWSEKNIQSRVLVQIETPTSTGTPLQIHFQGNSLSVFVPFTGDIFIENAIHAIVAALAIGIPREEIIARCQTLEAVPMRLELKHTLNDAIVIQDYYNSDLESLKIALNFLNQQRNHLPQWVIFSDLLQTHTKSKPLYSAVGKMLKDYHIDQLIAIGPQLAKNKQFLPKNTKYFPDTKQFLDKLRIKDFEKKAILLKGARAFRFERITEQLEEQSHQTIVEINLEALHQNLTHFRSKLKKNTRIMAMIKAFGYGSGTFELANLLEDVGVEYLAVAYTNEGISLRKAGIKLPILVLNPEPNRLDQLISYNLEPEVFSLTGLKNFINAAKSAERLKYPIHIKVETGMNRLGFSQTDLQKMIRLLRNETSVKIASVFSHFAASDNPEEKSFSKKQLETFLQFSDALKEVVPYEFLKHISNSAGIYEIPEAQLDMVRLGIGMYGISSNPSERKNLTPVMRFRTKISQIKTIKKGETVGYGRSFKAKNTTSIATLPVGYADGLFRNLSDGKGEVLVGKKRAPIIGKICMDMCMIDVTGLMVKEGDEVEIFGVNIPVEELAEKAGTIPYEILTHIPNRVPRVYHTE